MGDRLALVEEGGAGPGALLQDGREPVVEPELAPGAALLEGPVRLEEGLLGEEALDREGPHQRGAEAVVACAELGEEVTLVLVDDAVDDREGMDGHDGAAASPEGEA